MPRRIAEHPLMTVLLCYMIPIFVGGETIEDCIEKARCFFIERRFARKFKELLLRKQGEPMYSHDVRTANAAESLGSIRSSNIGDEDRAKIARALQGWFVPNGCPIRTLGLTRNTGRTLLSLFPYGDDGNDGNDGNDDSWE